MWDFQNFIDQKNLPPPPNFSPLRTSQTSLSSSPSSQLHLILLFLCSLLFLCIQKSPQTSSSQVSWREVLGCRLVTPQLHSAVDVEAPHLQRHRTYTVFLSVAEIAASTALSMAVMASSLAVVSLLLPEVTLPLSSPSSSSSST